MKIINFTNWRSGCRKYIKNFFDIRNQLNIIYNQNFDSYDIVIFKQYYIYMDILIFIE